MFKLAIPVMHVHSSIAAEAFYCRRLGFRREFAYRVDESKPDPCYMGLVPVRFEVDDVDALHAELVEKGVRIDTGPVDQTWGTREMYVKDADGNSIRFICPIDG